MSSNTQNTQRNNTNLNPYARALDAAVLQHSSHARKVVFVKGVFDIFLAISVMFFPTFAYSGPVGALVAKMTGLVSTPISMSSDLNEWLTQRRLMQRSPDWAAEADSAFAIASLIMGAGVAAFTACQSEANCAYRTIGMHCR